MLTANGDDLTDSSDPSRVMMRQIAGAFHQYEKARLVAKLKAARQRKRKAVGKVEGRKSWAEINPDLVAAARRLRRRSPKGHQRSLRDVAEELAKLGFVNERGKMFSPSSVQSMLSLKREPMMVMGSLCLGSDAGYACRRSHDRFRRT